jgi:hypothetical protein
MLRATKLVFFIALLGLSFIQSDKQKLLIKTKLDYFTVDNLGNIYTIREDEIIKFLPNGKLFNRYSNLKLGSISSVDATNPLKLLLYYRDFQQIVFLDNQLSPNSDPVSLERMGLEQTDLVCASVNNSFWIYNKQNNELIRFDQNSKKMVTTGNLKQILQTEMNPNFMLEYNNYLYLNCPETGIYVFDIFGAFSKLISIKNLKDFQVHENIIYFQKDSALCSYNHKLFQDACLKVSAARPIKISYFNNNIYSGYKDSVVVN